MKKSIAILMSLLLMLGSTAAVYAADVDEDDPVVYSDSLEEDEAIEEDEAVEKEAADEEDVVSPSDAADTIGSTSLVANSGSFIGIVLDEASKDYALVLNKDGKNIRGSRIDENGYGKLTLDEEAKTYCVVLNGAEFEKKDVVKMDNPNGLLLEFFLGGDYANRAYTLIDASGKTVDVTTDEYGFAGVSVAPSTAFELIPADNGDYPSLNDFSAMTVAQQENTNQKSNLPITIAFFCLLAIGGGYLCWDKFFKNRSKNTEDDE